MMKLLSRWVIANESQPVSFPEIWFIFGQKVKSFREIANSAQLSAMVTADRKFFASGWVFRLSNHWLQILVRKAYRKDDMFFRMSESKLGLGTTFWLSTMFTSTNLISKLTFITHVCKLFYFATDQHIRVIRNLWFVYISINQLNH